MQRKPGYPMVNCNIKMPDGMPVTESVPMVEDGEQMQRRQQLINFGHAQWGFNNWSWSVTKQDLDFVDFTNGKYWVGVAAFVSVNVKALDIHRENVGYATCSAVTKGAAIHKSRKVAVTNALRETLLSFGGSVATELIEHEAPAEPTALEAVPAPTPAPTVPAPAPAPLPNVPAACTPAVPHPPANIPQHVPAPAAAAVAAVKPCEAVAARARRVEGAALRAPPAPPQPAGLSRAPPRAPPQPRPTSNDAGKLENMNEEEARAERKRRQQKAQEEFRQRQQMMKPKHEDKQDLQKGNSFDTLLMDIPTQDIEIEQTGEGPEPAKRKSPTPEQSSKRRSVINRLDVITN